MPLIIDTERYRLPPGQYLEEKTTKDLIVLHFTAGKSCYSAWRTWSENPQRIATAYGIDPDGSVFEFFPPECWAYHLGVKGTHAHDRRSIGIEIANVGPLKREPGTEWLCWWPNDYRTRWCRDHESAKYVQQRFRGIDYWAAMPEEQQRAVGALVRHLCECFAIPLQWSQAVEDGAYLAHETAEGYIGVATHTSFRTDKYDVGPAFDWNYLRAPGPPAVAA